MIDRVAILFVAHHTAYGIGIIGVATQTELIKTILVEGDIRNAFGAYSVWGYVMAVGADVLFKLAFIIDLIMWIEFFVLRAIMAVVAEVGSVFIGCSAMKESIFFFAVELAAQALIAYFMADSTGDLIVAIQSTKKFCGHFIHHGSRWNHAGCVDVFIFRDGAVATVA